MVGTQGRSRFRQRHGIFAVLLVLSAFLLGNFGVVSINAHSMAGTIRDGDYVLVSRLHWFFRKRSPSSMRAPNGPVVILRSATGKGLMAKRIVAIGGDSIRIKDGHLILNGLEIRESYVRYNRYLRNGDRDSWPADLDGPGMRDIAVPKEHYFVLGDNRNDSTDSRHFGPLPEGAVVGSVVFVWRRP